MKNRSLKLLIIFGILNLLVFVGLCFVVWQIKIANDIYIDLKSTEDANQQKLSDLIGLEKDLNQSKDNIQKINSYFVQKNDKVDSKEGIVKFVQQVESLAKANYLNVVINSIDVGAPDEATFANVLESLNISLRTNGSWNNTNKFILMLENMQYNVDIKSLSLTKVAPSSKGVGAGWQSDLNIGVLKIK